MTKRAMYAGAVGVVLVVLVVVFERDIVLRRPGEISCDDGVRRRIDEREFSTQYWAYGVKLEGSVGGKAKLSGTLEPKQLQQLSESLQSAKEFQKVLVNGFNACAITKQQYGAYAARFQALDSLSRRLDTLTVKATLDAADQSEIGKVVDEYIELAQRLSSTTN
jgi:hypothetical protein